jgi:UDP-glucose 4-epimerase
MNVAVVGANGFIGRHLVKKLINNNALNLFLFGRSSISSFSLDLPYSSINLNDSQEILVAFKNIDLVYYFASSSIPSSSWESPQQEIKENLLPFINFLECISILNVKKIVFTSSAGTIYGSSKYSLKETADKHPFSPYGINKLSMEYFLNYFDKLNGLKHVIFRISNVYGEGQNTSNGLGVINTFLEKIVTNKIIEVFGDGEIVRNYIYIQDVVEVLAMVSMDESLISKTYNLSSDESFSINQIIKKINQITKNQLEVKYHPSRKSDNPIILLDNTKLKQDYKIQFTSILDGIQNTYSYLNATKSKV